MHVTNSMTVTPQYIVNGKLDAQVSPLDRGFAYGDGVFRTMRMTENRVVAWPLHYSKLMEDCNRLDIVCPSSDVLHADIQRLNEDRVPDAVIKIIVTRGEGTRGYALPALAQPNRVVIKSAYPLYQESNFSEGVSLHLCQLRLGHQPQLAGIKHLNRLENILARMEWNSSAFADGVLQDIDGNVIECTAGNLFIRIGKDLVTPDLSLCGVAGITRQRILQLSEALGLNIYVDRVSMADMMSADEVLICNSLYGAWQVIDFNHRQWPSQPLASTVRQLLQEQP
jgi:4-amino-4-deoxychorismate lyase